MKKRKKKTKRNHKKDSMMSEEAIKRVIEIAKKKPRKEEEKFFIKFSGTQLNVVLIIIFLIPFLFDGVIGYFNIKDQLVFIKPWFLMTIVSLLCMTLSVLLITVGTVLFPLRLKRKLNLISFATFMFGFLLFVLSIIALLVMVLVI